MRGFRGLLSLAVTVDFIDRTQRSNHVWRQASLWCVFSLLFEHWNTHHTYAVATGASSIFSHATTEYALEFNRRAAETNNSSDTPGPFVTERAQISSAHEYLSNPIRCLTT